MTQMIKFTGNKVLIDNDGIWIEVERFTSNIYSVEWEMNGCQTKTEFKEVQLNEFIKQIVNYTNDKQVYEKNI